MRLYDGITNLNLYEPVCEDASHLWGHFSIVAKEILRVDKSSLQVLSKNYKQILIYN